MLEVIIHGTVHTDESESSIILYTSLDNVKNAISIFIDNTATRVIRNLALSAMIRTRLADNPSFKVWLRFRWNVVYRGTADLDLLPATPRNTRL